MISRLGFTGSRQGMSSRQKKMFEIFLRKHPEIAEFHHGDCVGADKEAHGIIDLFVRPIGARVPETHAHPPLKDTYRAYCRADVIHQTAPYLLRNRAIVEVSDFLVAAPVTRKEQLRSGTWHTVRYARERGVAVYVLWP